MILSGFISLNSIQLPYQYHFISTQLVVTGFSNGHDTDVDSYQLNVAPLANLGNGSELTRFGSGFTFGDSRSRFTNLYFGA